MIRSYEISHSKFGLKQNKIRKLMLITTNMMSTEKKKEHKIRYQIVAENLN